MQLFRLACFALSYTLAPYSLYTIVFDSLPRTGLQPSVRELRAFLVVCAVASTCSAFFTGYKSVTSSYARWLVANYSYSAGAPAALSLRSITKWMKEAEPLSHSRFAQTEPFTWFWMQDIWLFAAGAWTTFLWVGSTRHGIRNIWAYILLSQSCAMAPAMFLFFLAIISAPPNPKRRKGRIPMHLAVPVHLSYIALLYAPYLSRGAFTMNNYILFFTMCLPHCRRPLREGLVELFFVSTEVKEGIKNVSLSLAGFVEQACYVCFLLRPAALIRLPSYWPSQIYSFTSSHSWTKVSIMSDYVWIAAALGAMTAYENGARSAWALAFGCITMTIIVMLLGLVGAGIGIFASYTLCDLVQKWWGAGTQRKDRDRTETTP